MKRTLNVLVFFFLSWPLAAQFVSVDDAIDMALQRNFDVRVQRATAALAENDNHYAPGAFLPLLNATSTYLKTSADSKAVTFVDTVTVRNGVKSSGLVGSAQLTWTLFDGTRMFATRQRIRELSELGEVNLKNQMMNSVAAVITSYYNIVRIKQQIKAVHELMIVNEERVKLAEKKLQVGTGGKPELLQAKVDYNAQRILLVQQEAQIVQLKDQLNGLLGMGLADGYDITDSIPINLNLTMEEIMEGIETTNQALLAAKKGMEITDTQLWEMKAGRSPVLNFVSAYNFNRTENTLATSPFSLKYSRNKGFNYGLSITVPILNGFNQTRLVHQARINQDRQRLVYEGQKIIVTVGVRNAFSAYETARKALLIAEENIVLAKENVFIALESFKKGVTTYIELRTAQQTLADAYALLILARYNAKAAETELLRLKGALLK